MSQVSELLFIWTHYYGASIINARADVCSKFRMLQDVEKDS